MRFKVGDRVCLVRPDPVEGRLCIGEKHFTREVVVTVTHLGRTWIGLSNGYSVNDCMLDFAAPLTPFDALVNDYIRSELKNDS